MVKALVKHMLNAHGIYMIVNVFMIIVVVMVAVMMLHSLVVFLELQYLQIGKGVLNYVVLVLETGHINL
jgi:hypothetical protein